MRTAAQYAGDAAAATTSAALLTNQHAQIAALMLAQVYASLAVAAAIAELPEDFRRIQIRPNTGPL